MSVEAKTDAKGRVLLSGIPGLRSLNVLAHPDNVEIHNDCPDVMEITAVDTLAMAAKFSDATWEKAKLDEDFKSRLAIVFPDLDITKDERHLRDYPIAYRHVVGMIVCINKAINTGRRPFVRLPEMYLHPKSQAGLGSLFARYAREFDEVKGVSLETDS